MAVGPDQRGGQQGRVKLRITRVASSATPGYDIVQFPTRKHTFQSQLRLISWSQALNPVDSFEACAHRLILQDRERARAIRLRTEVAT